MSAERAFDAWAVQGPPIPASARTIPLPGEGEASLGLRYPDASPRWIGEVAGRLLASRQALRQRPVAEIAEVLGRVGSRFLDPTDPLRIEALELIPRVAGISEPMAVLVLDGMAADWQTPRLLRLLENELGDPALLDGFIGALGSKTATGPRLCFQVLSGSVPGLGVTALIRSLLLKGPTLLKPGLGDAVLPVLFARALAAVDEGLGNALAVVYWPGGSTEIEEAAASRADVVVAYGSDASVRAIRDVTPPSSRFVAYGNRIGAGVVGRGALADEASSVAEEVAQAVSLFDRRGCVCPQIVLVEEGGATSAAAFAEMVADALARIEERLPSGRLDAAESSSLHQARGTAELLVSADPRGWVRHGHTATWTVLFTRDQSVPGVPVGRSVRIEPIEQLSAVGDRLGALTPHLQSLGVAGVGSHREAIDRAAAAAGVSRIVPFRTMSFPPPWWHHDGQGPLEVLLRRTDRGE